MQLSEFNNWLPETCAYTEAQQQKLFLSPSSVMVKTMYHLTKKNLELLKSETTFLLGCDHGEFMKTFLKRVICDDVRALIDGTIKRLPVRDQFLIHIDEDGRPALKWMEMSGYKLHKLIDLLILNIQGLNTTTFVDPLKKAIGHAFDFMNDFKYISLEEHTMNPMLTTEVIAKAKSAFSMNNMRMHNWIKDKSNSAALVHNIFSDLKDSTKNSLERDRNEIIMRLFVMKRMVSKQFPTVKSTIEYWPFINACEDILTKLAEDWRTVKLWAEPSLNTAMV